MRIRWFGCADAFDRDVCARSRNRARTKGCGGGGELVDGIGDNRKVWHMLVIRFGGVTIVLVMSFEC